MPIHAFDPLPRKLEGINEKVQDFVDLFIFFPQSASEEEKVVKSHTRLYQNHLFPPLLPLF